MAELHFIHPFLRFSLYTIWNYGSCVIHIYRYYYFE